jgi:hypothetical protein
MTAKGNATPPGRLIGNVNQFIGAACALSHGPSDRGGLLRKERLRWEVCVEEMHKDWKVGGCSPVLRVPATGKELKADPDSAWFRGEHSAHSVGECSR